MDAEEAVPGGMCGCLSSSGADLGFGSRARLLARLALALGRALLALLLPLPHLRLLLCLHTPVNAVIATIS